MKNVMIMEDEKDVKEEKSHLIPRKFISIDIGIRNLGLSVLEYNFDKNSEENKSWKKLIISHLELIDIVEVSQEGKRLRANTQPKTAKNMNIHTLCDTIVHIFMKRESLLSSGITDIRIEQQPIFRGQFAKSNLGSVRMKIIQHCLLTFFETYYSIHKHLVKPHIAPSSPANKLKCLLQQDNFINRPLQKTSDSTDYKQRKDKAVEGFNQIIQWCTINETLQTLYMDAKKKNDFADCILQAVYELQLFGCELKEDMEKEKIKQRLKEEKMKMKKNPNVRKRKRVEEPVVEELSLPPLLSLPPPPSPTLPQPKVKRIKK
jgi:hypothetical protein